MPGLASAFPRHRAEALRHHALTCRRSSHDRRSRGFSGRIPGQRQPRQHPVLFSGLLGSRVLANRRWRTRSNRSWSRSSASKSSTETTTFVLSSRRASASQRRIAIPASGALGTLHGSSHGMMSPSSPQRPRPTPTPETRYVQPLQEQTVRSSSLPLNHALCGSPRTGDE